MIFEFNWLWNVQLYWTIESNIATTIDCRSLHILVYIWFPKACVDVDAAIVRMLPFSLAFIIVPVHLSQLTEPSCDLNGTIFRSMCKFCFFFSFNSWTLSYNLSNIVRINHRVAQKQSMSHVISTFYYFLLSIYICRWLP